MLGVEYLKIGTASTMTNFNGGYQDMFKVFKELGIIPGESCVNFWEKKLQNSTYGKKSNICL